MPVLGKRSTPKPYPQPPLRQGLTEFPMFLLALLCPRQALNLGSSCCSLQRSWNCRPVALGLLLCYCMSHWSLRLGSLRVDQVFAIWQRWVEAGAWPENQVFGRSIPPASAFSLLPLPRPPPRFMPRLCEFEMTGGLSHLMAKGLLRARSLLSSLCVPCQPSLLWQT